MTFITPRSQALVALVLIGSLFLMHEANAQTGKIMLRGKGPAYVVPPEDDPSYHLMGEFSGSIRLKKKKRQKLSLQIRAIAGDQFRAIAYFGGLPGQSPKKPEEMRLIGLESENSVVLSGGPWAIFVDPEGCSIVSSEGKMLGRLNRVSRVSPTLGAPPPEGAVVIFDGTNVDHLIDAQTTENGLLKEGVKISPMFQDFNLHAEFRLPYMPQADGQQRGNSGLYLQGRYECQVLDSFGTEIQIDGLGALYKQKKPDVNMALPPLVWQTYDVHFTAPRWNADGEKIRDAHISSWINGVKVQDDVALRNKTGAGKEEAPILLPIHIQNHGDPVRYQNIWIVDRGLSSGKFPVIATKEQREAASAVGFEGVVVAEAVEPEPSESKEEPAEKVASSESDDKVEDAAAEEAKQEADPPKQADNAEKEANGPEGGQEKLDKAAGQAEAAASLQEGSQVAQVEAEASP